jgi:hypothetical protein
MWQSSQSRLGTLQPLCGTAHSQGISLCQLIWFTLAKDFVVLGGITKDRFRFRSDSSYLVDVIYWLGFNNSVVALSLRKEKFPLSHWQDASD